MFVAAPLVSLLTLFWQLADSERIEFTFSQNPSDAEMQAQCPLEKSPLIDEKGLQIQRARPGDEPGCCSDTHIFRCKQSKMRLEDRATTKRDFKMSDGKVVPSGTEGKVVAFDGNRVNVRFAGHMTLFQYYHHQLEPVTTSPFESLSYYCDCALCPEVDQNFDIKQYSTLMAEGAGEVFVSVGLNPKNVEPMDDGLWPAGHKYVLFLNPRKDNSGAFSMTFNLCSRIDCWRKRGFSVVVRIVDSLKEATKVVEQFRSDAADRPIHAVILGGHGSTDGIVWGQDALKTGDAATKSFFDVLRPKLKLDATIVLDSCLTAGATFISSNFFSYVARKFHGRKVIGSKVALSPKMWQQRNDSQCLAADLADFVESGQSQMAVAKEGLANCKELGQDDLAELAAKQGQCLGRCRKRCTSSFKDDAVESWAKLQRIALESTGESIDDRGACSVFGRKRVCNVKDLNVEANGRQ